MSLLEERVAIVTGAAGGMGAVQAELLAGEGATVVLTDVLDDQGRATTAAIGGSTRYARLDVRCEEDWERVVDETVREFGRIDVLVNNAGVLQLAPLVSTSLETWKHIVDVNQTAVFLGMRTVAPAMIAAGRGSIVNVSSIAGILARPLHFAYAASKWAVRGMTKVAARELAGAGVRVNSVHPGLVDTRMADELRRLGDDAMDQLVAQIPMGRMTTADEIARTVLFLASEQSSHTTGTELVVDGGMCVA